MSLTVAYICFTISLIILRDTLSWHARLLITHSQPFCHSAIFFFFFFFFTFYLSIYVILFKGLYHPWSFGNIVHLTFMPIKHIVRERERERERERPLCLFTPSILLLPGWLDLPFAFHPPPPYFCINKEKIFLLYTYLVSSIFGRVWSVPLSSKQGREPTQAAPTCYITHYKRGCEWVLDGDLIHISPF